MTFRHSALDLYDRLKIAFTRGKQDLRPRFSFVPTKPQEEIERTLHTLGIDDLISMDIPERELAARSNPAGQWSDDDPREAGRFENFPIAGDRAGGGRWLKPNALVCPEGSTCPLRRW